MQVTHLVSSNLECAAWHRGDLFITFKNGSIYSYNDVPKQVFNELVQAESHGKFFNQHIRLKYHYQKEV
jgi:fibrillarin-like rRNA methylase